jgi:hypothetical protein
VTTFLPDDEPERSRTATAVAKALAGLAASSTPRELLLEEVDDLPAGRHPLAPALLRQGFSGTYGGLQYRPPRTPTAPLAREG